MITIPKKLMLISICIFFQITTFAQTQKGADIDGEAADDRSGGSVSMPDANTLAIGAPRNDGTANNAGHVRIYTWNGSYWQQKGDDIDGKNTNELLGLSISMPNDNTLAIGAPGYYGTATDIGLVRIYSWHDSAWIQKGADINGEAAGDQSGWSISMPDENTLAIGAKYNKGTATDAGHVRIYNWNGPDWLQKGADIDGKNTDELLGQSVSMPNSYTLAIGAPGNFGTGLVRIYSWHDSAWFQKGADISGEAAGDQSGWSVSLPDENTVAIGAMGNSGTEPNSGQVKIYTWSGSNWLQKGGSLDGEAAGDQSGWSVSMPDSITVAIGAFLNDETGANAGHVRVYSLDKTNSFEKTFGNQLTVFPNPTKDKVTIELGHNYNEISVIIRNALGQEVMRTSFNKTNAFNLNIPDAPGLYILELHSPEHKALLKVLKN